MQVLLTIYLSAMLSLACSDVMKPEEKKDATNGKKGNSSNICASKEAKKNSSELTSDIECPPAEEATPELEKIVNTPGKADCDKEQKIFDREKDKCLNAKLDMSWCETPESAARHFDKKFDTEGKVEKEIKKRLKEGFNIDQCGDSDYAPIITFIKRFPGQGRIETYILTINKPSAD